jgi:hypothetical protein
MTRVDASFTAFRLWWRGASNGPRSRAVAAGTATVGFLVWIAVPSGGGVLANFTAAGFPVNAASPSGQAAASSPGQGAPLAANASGLGASSAVDTSGASGAPADTSLGAATGGGASVGSTSGDSGGPSPAGGDAPGTGVAPTTPSATCPVSLPATNTALDGYEAQLSALCAQLLAPGSGSVPAGSLPGGGSGAGNSGAAGPAQVPRQWLYLDAPLGASGAPVSTWSPALAAVMTGRTATVPVGLVQGATVSPALAGALATLVQDGALVRLLVVPAPASPGGPAAFGSWVTQVLGALGPVGLVEIGTGAAPAGSSPGRVAADTVAGLAAAHDAPGHPSAGITWLDGGTASADGPVWSSLDTVAAWSKSSFVARSLDAAGACSSPAAFASTLGRYPTAAALPVVSDAVQAPAPAPVVGADSRCLKASLMHNPATSVALWRLWEGPVPRS